MRKSFAYVLYIIVRVKFIFQIGLFYNYFVGNEMIGCVKENNSHKGAVEGCALPPVI